MIEIRHKETGAVLHQVKADTLQRADLTGLNLCDADLSGRDLAGTILAGTVCRGTRFHGANLDHADLRGAYLAQADFRDANLTGALLFSDSLDTADLTDANLTGANLTGAYLAEAKLVRANLCYANLQSAYLAGVDLTGARIAFTLFADCHSLPHARGLDQIEHLGPSTLDLSTLRAGVAALPEAFLRGVGLASEEIKTLRTLYAETKRYPSCFLAFVAADSDFAQHLRADLLAHDIPCWPFHADLNAGYVLQIVFNHAARRRSRLVLLCSEAAVRQGGILAAAQNVTGHHPETDTPRPLLLLLDDFLLDRTRSPLDDWSRYLEHCPTLDFRHWQDSAGFAAAFERLLDALRSS